MANSSCLWIWQHELKHSTAVYSMCPLADLQPAYAAPTLFRQGVQSVTTAQKPKYLYKTKQKNPKAQLTGFLTPLSPKYLLTGAVQTQSMPPHRGNFWTVHPQLAEHLIYLPSTPRRSSSINYAASG